MSKRKKGDPNPEEEEEDEDDQPRDKQRQQQPQKVYDFHKKTIEVYPERLRELNRQFSSSISSQITTEPYSVLVGNCLDYVRQYFKYEDDFLQYSPWLATRLKQSRSDIVKCLQETIDVYEALARHDFDHILDKNNTTEIASDDSISNKSDNSATPSFQFRPMTTTASSSAPSFTLPKSTAASDSTPSTKSTPTVSDSIPATNFNFTKPTTTTASDTTPSTGFTFSKPLPTTTTTNDSMDFSFAKSTAATTTTNSSAPLTGFSFKMPTATTASPEKTANTSPFSFSIPNTGFGTSTFTSPSIGNPTSSEKSSISSASSISFAPPKFSFAPTPSAGTEQPGNTEDNEDEASEPPEPEKVEHESDAKLTYRCRMGVKKGDKLIKRGPVQVVLKEANGKHQLIVRSDDALGRLFLNILWSKPVEVKKNSTKDLVFVCQLNPGMPEIKEGEFVTILLRFDNETERNDAHDKLNKERS